MAIPESTRNGIDDYVQGHIPPGDFLKAVLENNLMGTVFASDDENLGALLDICRYVWNYTPATCWGSPAKVKAWLYPETVKETADA